MRIGECLGGVGLDLLVIFLILVDLLYIGILLYLRIVGYL